MISPTPRLTPPPRWQRELAAGVGSVRELLDLLGLEAARLPELDPERSHFPLRVPRSFVRRMRAGDAEDPLLRQVLPLKVEQTPSPGFVADPLEERDRAPVPGILHKYHGRVLFLTTGACGVHCRYCFRRHFPYEEQARPGNWPEAVSYIASDPTIEEVILSGGDPLSLLDAKLRQLALSLAEIPHVQRLRVHTRMPIVLPSRIEPATVDWLTATRLQPVMVVHANHPREIDRDVVTALANLSRAGVTLLNQSVLLAGVNDDAATLAALSRRLFAAGVLPYYLNVLDRVEGAAHFEVGDDAVRRIYWQLIDLLPGYLMPRWVREMPRAGAKIPVDPGPYPGLSAEEHVAEEGTGAERSSPRDRLSGIS